MVRALTRLRPAGLKGAGMDAIRVMIARAKKEAAANPVPDPVEPLRVIPAPAPGTAGDLKLYDTDPRDAAMIMAIVADTLGKPLNELRFISIKEVKDE